MNDLLDNVLLCFIFTAVVPLANLTMPIEIFAATSDPNASNNELTLVVPFATGQGPLFSMSYPGLAWCGVVPCMGRCGSIDAFRAVLTWDNRPASR